MRNCECSKPATGDDGLCEDCRHIRDDDFANIGMYVSDSGEVLDIEPKADFETCWNCGAAIGDNNTHLDPCEEVASICPVCGGILTQREYVEYDGSEDWDGSDFHPADKEQGQTLVVDGQRVTADDVRRMINAFQRTRWALIQTGIELNKRSQIIRRLEVEIGDCGYAPTYSITPKGYDVLREMGR
jgi:hypothetical protein